MPDAKQEQFFSREGLWGGGTAPAHGKSPGPMRNYEILREVPEDERIDILDGLLKTEKDGYKAAVNALAPIANVRPVFVMRMPPPKRHAWLSRQLCRKSGDSVAGNVIQFWLAGPKKEMLIEFLDSLGIEHKDGIIDDLPENEPDKKPLESAVDSLLAKHPPSHVRLYLHAFLAMDDTPWPTLGEILHSDPRLNPGAAESAVADPRP